MKNFLKWLFLIITFPWSFMVVFFIQEYKTAKENEKYKNYIKYMNEKYHKGYCPIIKKNCCYEYCEFWNLENKDCDLKK